jgi:hypothetical protein
MRPVRPAEDKVNTFSMFCEFFNVETMQPAQEGRYVLWVSRERDGRVVQQFHVTGFWDGKSWKDDCGCEWVMALLADVPVADVTMKQHRWYARDVAKVMIMRQKMEAARDYR